MKPALIPCLLALSVLPARDRSDADELAPLYRAGQVYAWEEERWMAFDVVDVAMTVNGREVTGEMLEQVRAGMTDEREETKSRSTTWIEEVEDGAPVRVRRLFDVLTQTQVDGEDETEYEGVLLDREFTLRADAGEETARAELAEGDVEVDERFLADHRLANLLDRYLPEEPVEVGDRWELDDAVVRELMDADGPELFDDGEDGDDPFEELMRESVRASAAVEYERREEVDGVACAVLLVSIEMDLPETEIDPSSLDLAEEGMEVAAWMSIRLEGTERVWFAIEEGHHVRAEGEMEGGFELRMRLTQEEMDLEMDIEIQADASGGMRSSCSRTAAD